MCGCETTSSAPAAAPADNGTTFTVAGMTCQSCAMKVTAAVREVPGVTDVHVDLATGRITAEGTAAHDSIRDAIVAAGYTATNP